MRFDDRLTTVLAQPADDAHDRAVRWRQLVELLARGGGDFSSPIARQALDEVRADAPSIDEQVRAGAARAIAGLKLPADLIAAFAADRLSIAAPVLAAAALTPDQWRELHGAASAETRGFIASLHPELFAAPPEADKPRRRAEPARPEPVPPPEAPAEDKPMPSISELVARIERLRGSRDRPERPPTREREATAAGTAALFRWECLPSGEIGWVQGAPRGALVGRSLANAADEGFDPRVERAFALRAPFRDAAMTIARDGPLAGEWRISGVPAFEPADGRFAGYRGVAVRQRSESAPGAAPAADSAPADHDALRELVHEIKTPLNAIIGFAEIIEQQYLGPADHRYRARAGEIVGHARILLEAIDDLDFAAKLQSGRSDPGVAADLASLLGQLADELEARAIGRGAVLTMELRQGQACRTNASLAERLLRRFGNALVDALGEGERLTIRTLQRSGQCLVSADRPRLLQGADAEALLRAGSAAETGSAESVGFWLRLVRGLARIAGGDLVVDEQRLTLVLPEAAG